ncbi:MAG: hypothetical protein K8L97_07675 [Anaerolineae bacterium]|nr:hypothetical protein [Anaerolineae bacterium]
MFNSEQQQIAQGLKILQSQCAKYAENSYLKLRAMQEVYFLRTSIAYSVEERQLIQHYLDALIYKFHMASLALEQLWALRDEKSGEIIQAIEQSLDRLSVSDEELTIISFAFDTFLFHSRSYIDFYMLYICYVLKTGHEGKISQDKFRKALGRVTESNLNAKAMRVRDYFDISVYGESNAEAFVAPNWGSLLTSLRDKVAHRDIIKPSFESDKTLAKGVLLDWPTIRKMTYADFHQMMENGMYFLMQDISQILYDITWISGPYRVGMFDL